MGTGGEQLGMTSMAGEGFRLRISCSQEKAVMGIAPPGTEGEGVCMLRGLIYTRFCILGSLILLARALPLWVLGAFLDRVGFPYDEFCRYNGGSTSGGVSHVDDASQDAIRT